MAWQKLVCWRRNQTGIRRDCQDNQQKTFAVWEGIIPSTFTRHQLFVPHVSNYYLHRTEAKSLSFHLFKLRFSCLQDDFVVRCPDSLPSNISFASNLLQSRKANKICNENVIGFAEPPWGEEQSMEEWRNSWVLTSRLSPFSISRINISAAFFFFYLRHYLSNAPILFQAEIWWSWPWRNSEGMHLCIHGKYLHSNGLIIIIMQ